MFSPNFFSFGLLIDVPDLEVRLGEDVLREVVHVSLVVDDLGDAGIDEDLGTLRAREGGGVDLGALHADTEIGRLGHCVLFRMDTPAELMAGAGWHVHEHSETSLLLAVGYAAGSPVVSGGKHVIVLHDDRSDLASETGGPGRCQFSHLHEVFVGRGSFHAKKDGMKVLGSYLSK